MITINLEKTSLLDSENIYELYKQGYMQAKNTLKNKGKYSIIAKEKIEREGNI